jgi:tetratricopeptide (TPR) repeat protein
MSKSQVIIVVVAIIAVIFLFNLPRHLVKNEKSSGGKGAEKATITEIKEEAHRNNISEADLLKLEKLRKSYQSVSDKEKKLKFADSLANLFRSLNEFDSSAAYFAEMVAISSAKENLIKAGDAYFDASVFALKREKSTKLVETSRDYYQRVLDREPQNLEVKTKMARTYFGSEDPQNTMTGVKILKEVISEDPDNEEALYTLGQLSIQSKQFDKAVERFQSLLKTKPENIEAEFWLGYSQMMLGNKKEARASFERVIKNTDDPQVKTSAENYLKELK